MPERQRLDVLLVERKLYPSRSRARDALMRGAVLVNGLVANKPGQSVSDDVDISVLDPARHYVSRAALKLIAALQHFPIKTQGVNALDIGVSTGGFSQVLLENGVAHIIAVDVGHGQLDASLIGNPAITLYEGLNARALKIEHLKSRSIGLIVSDVSFI